MCTKAIWSTTMKTSPRRNSNYINGSLCSCLSFRSNGPILSLKAEALTVFCHLCPFSHWFSHSFNHRIFIKSLLESLCHSNNHSSWLSLKIPIHFLSTTLILALNHAVFFVLMSKGFFGPHWLSEAAQSGKKQGWTEEDKQRGAF